ncbi:MAG: hypothetical protein UV51_C0010G0029 [Candidatus Woesebacteria bacterium GW2011_GWC1_42_9]|nr:MAG: hypothetical protein UV51_C0010G0029 [Candidatus Woesebacteria bacterium GW2011_GWC1_42_9]
MITVTDTGATITIEDGNSTISIVKSKVSVSSRGSNVRIQWGETSYLETAYTNFTAPSEASAVAVAAAIEAFLDTASETVSVGAGTANIGKVGANASVAANITRATNTTQYAINDVMNGTDVTSMLAFAIASAADKGGWIVGGQMVSSNGGVATPPNVDLLLFSSNFTIAADNAAFAPTFAQLQTYLGKIRFSTWVDRGAMGESDGSTESAFKFTPAAGTSTIYGVLVLQNTYTPASAETLQISINAEQY